MKELLFALIAGGLGFLLLAFGYKLARIIIPIWAFFAGFSIGASGVADALNAEFIGTTLGIVVGLIVGLVFALFSYFFYSLAVVLLGATVGYWIGTGLMSLIGIDKGFLSATVGIIIGIIFAILTLGLNVAKYLLIVLTSLAGATAIVGAFMLLFNSIQLNDFAYHTAESAISNSTIWSIVAVVLFILGVIVQTISNKNYTITDWTTSQGAPKNTNTYKSE